MRSRVVAGLLALCPLLAGCAYHDPNDPPQSHVGTCTHYQSTTRVLENVPNCEMRTQHTMLNGLPPAYPGNKS